MRRLPVENRAFPSVGYNQFDGSRGVLSEFGLFRRQPLPARCSA